MLSTSVTLMPLRSPSCTTSTIWPELLRLLLWPAGISICVLCAAIAPSTLYGMPPTGPIVPSGLIVPVIVMPGSSVSPRMSARVATVIRPPALGPSILPMTSKSTSRFVSGAPVRRVATVTADHPAASHCSPVPATAASVNPTRSLWSGDGPMRTVTGFVPPTVLPFASVDTKSGSTVTDPVPVPTAVVVGVFFAVVVVDAFFDPPLHADATNAAATTVTSTRRPDRCFTPTVPVSTTAPRRAGSVVTPT